MALVHATGVWDAGALCMTPDFAACRRREVTIPQADADVLCRLAERIAGLPSASQPIAQSCHLYTREKPLPFSTQRKTTICNPRSEEMLVSQADRRMR